MVVKAEHQFASFIRSVRERLYGAVSPDGTELEGARSSEPTRESEPALDPVYYEAQGCSKAEVVIETGLSPEEYIVGLAEGHDGWIKQQQLIRFTSWTPSTMSRLLQRMEDDGEIARRQVGREKYVCLPGEVPHAARSPADPDDGPDSLLQ